MISFIHQFIIEEKNIKSHPLIQADRRKLRISRSQALELRGSIKDIFNERNFSMSEFERVTFIKRESLKRYMAGKFIPTVLGLSRMIDFFSTHGHDVSFFYTLLEEDENKH